MKKALLSLNDNNRKKINEKFINGMRVFHFFSVKEILNTANVQGLYVIDPVETPEGHMFHGIITYRSGKGIPAAAVFLVKKSEK